VGGEARLDVGQAVLEHREVRDQREALPHALLVRDRPVRAGADQRAPALGRHHHLDRDDAGWIADLERAVDVEAHERDHAPARSNTAWIITMRPSSRLRLPARVISSTRSPITSRWMLWSGTRSPVLGPAASAGLS